MAGLDEPNVVFSVFKDEVSLSDLKGVSELLMSRTGFDVPHTEMIRSKNFTFIGGRQYTFSNNLEVADLLDMVVDGELSKKQVLSDMVVVLESFEGETYFDHRKFLQRVKKHVSKR